MHQVEKAKTNLKTVFLAFGSNIFGDLLKSTELVKVSYRLLFSAGVRIVKKSTFYQTPGFPAGEGPDYINSVVCAVTDLSAQDLLKVLHRIEKDCGRERNARWGARSLDIDLLDYAGQILPDRAGFEHWRDLSLQDQQRYWPDQLILPHPRICDRAFVMIPLQEVAPEWVHPVTDQTVSQLLDRLPASDRADVRVFDGAIEQG